MNFLRKESFKICSKKKRNEVKDLIETIVAFVGETPLTICLINRLSADARVAQRCSFALLPEKKEKKGPHMHRDN